MPPNYHRYDSQSPPSPCPTVLSPSVSINDMSDELVDKLSLMTDDEILISRNDTTNEAETTPSTTERSSSSSKHLMVLLICAFGICFCYLSHGILLERFFSQIETNGRPITSFLLLSQTFTNVIVAWVWKNMEQRLFRKGNGKKKEEGRLNQKLIFMASFCFFAAMTATNESLNYVSYPTATLAKSSKLIPTMMMGLLVEKKSYTHKEWTGAALITIGIILFNYSRMKNHQTSGSTGEKQDSSYGLALLLFSLGMDGLLGSCQSILKQQSQYRKSTPIETMLYMNLYAFLLLLPTSLLLTNQFTNGLELLQTSPQALPMILLLNGSAAAGQIFIFFTIHLFSPLVCTIITTTRKFFTILVSVVRFGHVFERMQWGCVCLVFGGIYLEIVGKSGSSSGKKKKKVD